MKPIQTSCQPTRKLPAGSIARCTGLVPNAAPAMPRACVRPRKIASMRAEIAGRDIGRADESEDRTDSLQDEADHSGGEAALSKYKAADAHCRNSKGNGLTGAVAVEQQSGDQSIRA